MNHFSCSTSEIIQIHAHIVDELLLKYYVGSNCDSVSLLRWYSKTDELTYKLRVNSTTHFNLCVKQISTRMSFNQTVSSAKDAKQIVGGGGLNVITDAVERTSVRSTVAVNWQCLDIYICQAKPVGLTVSDLILRLKMEIRTSIFVSQYFLKLTFEIFMF